MLGAVLAAPGKLPVPCAESAADQDMLFHVDADGDAAPGGGADPLAASEEVVIAHDDAPAPQVEGDESCGRRQGFGPEGLAVGGQAEALQGIRPLAGEE